MGMMAQLAADQIDLIDPYEGDLAYSIERGHPILSYADDDEESYIEWLKQNDPAQHRRYIEPHNLVLKSLIK